MAYSIRIDQKWQARWEALGFNRFDPEAEGETLYCLEMFSYPSGAKLHIGHWYNYALSDSWARMKKMQGYNLFQPMGFDAFGLPAENYAIRTGIHPETSTLRNMEAMERQLHEMGGFFAWDHSLATCLPDYYKWTQWLFLQLYKHGLAYRKNAPVNWCPSCRTVLANEQVKDGRCDRCDTEVTRKNLTQWFFRITDYAQELLDGLEGLDWPEKTKKIQTNWIGRSEGGRIRFALEKDGAALCGTDGEPLFLDVFTTRADTLFGVTYVVCAPEAEVTESLLTEAQRPAALAYIEATRKASDIERQATDRPKTGVFTGSYAVHPFSGEKLPVWISDYVIASYGTGAVMAVPAHDTRDFAFAAQYGLPVRRVIRAAGDACADGVCAEGSNAGSSCGEDSSAEGSSGEDSRTTDPGVSASAADGVNGATNSVNGATNGVNTVNAAPAADTADLPFTAEGILLDSGSFTGLSSAEGRKAILAALQEAGKGEATVNYRLRDWLVSRQRYWGAPIPVVYCEDCGIVPVPEEQLPVVLPKDVEFRPDGSSPLANCEAFMQTTCPCCGKPARRDPDTLDTFVCSSWYYLRYPDNRNADAPFDPEKINALLPVDQYIGGAEHAAMHLLYARFITKALRDMGYLRFDEPFRALVHQGVILGSDGFKMSKSRGNTVVPDDYVSQYGADVFRLYLAFAFAYTEGGPWSDSGIRSIAKFAARIERQTEEVGAVLRAAGLTWQEAKAPAAAALRGPEKDLNFVLHRSIAGVTRDADKFQFNTALSRIMELSNALHKYLQEVKAPDAAFLGAVHLTLLRLLAPFAPHLAEELWEQTGNGPSIFLMSWPACDPAALEQDTVEIAVQINGQVRHRLHIPSDAAADDVRALVLAEAAVQALVADRPIRKFIYVPRRLANLVV